MQPDTSSLVSFPFPDSSHSDLVSIPSIKVSVYPLGVVSRRLGRVYKKPQCSRPRGKIKCFSAKASTRLRTFVIKHFVPNTLTYAHTWTVRRQVSDQEWSQICARVRRRIIRLGIACVWRVQMHTDRKVPHLHCICYVENRDQNLQLKQIWLECTGESGDPYAVKYAVKFKQTYDSGWIAYMAQRQSQHAKEQVGGTGKQWGIWNKKAFAKQTPLECDLTQHDADRFRRFLPKLLNGAGSKSRRRVPRHGSGMHTTMAQHSFAVPSGTSAEP